MKGSPTPPTRPSIRKSLAGLERSLLDGERTRPAEQRRAAAVGDGGTTGALHDYLERVRNNAYAVTDEEVAELRRAGHGDDELFELTICAAYGAARERLDAGLAAVALAYESD